MNPYEIPAKHVAMDWKPGGNTRKLFTDLEEEAERECEMAGREYSRRSTVGTSWDNSRRSTVGRENSRRSMRSRATMISRQPTDNSIKALAEPPKKADPAIGFVGRPTIKFDDKA